MGNSRETARTLFPSKVRERGDGEPVVARVLAGEGDGRGLAMTDRLGAVARKGLPIQRQIEE